MSVIWTKIDFCFFNYWKVIYIIKLLICFQKYNLKRFFFQLCNCHSSGSLSNQCNMKTGLCKCRIGYEGNRCDRCMKGYYNFPTCRPCNCHPGGTQYNQCNDDGACQCDPYGSCLCKVYNLIIHKCPNMQGYTYIRKDTIVRICRFFLVGTLTKQNKNPSF